MIDVVSCVSRYRGNERTNDDDDWEEEDLGEGVLPQAKQHFPQYNNYCIHDVRCPSGVRVYFIYSTAALSTVPSTVRHSVSAEYTPVGIQLPAHSIVQ